MACQLLVNWPRLMMKQLLSNYFSTERAEASGGKTTVARPRRRFLAQSGAIAVNAVWLPAFKLGRESARATCPPPPNFPASIELYQQVYENWAHEIRVEDLWTCAPGTP